MKKQSPYLLREVADLDRREHIRRRPGMYIGGTNERALHHLFYEVLDNSVESAFVGNCDTITVRLQPDNIITLEDNDTTFPAKLTLSTWNEKYNKHTLDVIMTEVNWKFDDDSYRMAVGLQAVILSIVCALSASMTVQVRHNNMIWKRLYKAGLPVGAVQYYRSTSDVENGFTVSFQPDFSILEPNQFDYDRVARRCADAVYNTPNLAIHLIDKRELPYRQQTFHVADGIRSLVEKLNKEKTPLHDIIHVSREIEAKERDGTPFVFYVEIAMQYTDADETIERNYVNTVSNIADGVHMEAFRATIQSTVNHYLKNINDPLRSLRWDELSGGLTAVISIRHPDPRFESPTKTHLMNPEIYGGVANMIYPVFYPYVTRELGDHFQAIFETKS